MASRDLKDAMPQLQLAFTKAKEEWAKLRPDAPQPIVVCSFRSDKEQQDLYNLGRTVIGKKVTNAKPGQSKHNLYPSHAIDIAFIKNDKADYNQSLFEDFAPLMKKYLITWGGDFKSIKDRPHFEI